VMSDLAFHPITPERLDDLETVFGDCHDADQCWCGYWLGTAAAYRAGKAGGNRDAFRARVAAGDAPGLIAYAGEVPAGWVCVAPRAQFVRLEKSRNFPAIDPRPVWCVICFVLARAFRGRGLMRPMLRSAVAHARAAGAPAVEGFPFIPDGPRTGSGNLFPGSLNAFLDEGFTEVARPSTTRARVLLELA
jgi:GNAT superfamily N-acetyltransferase